jgi:hypothetical protein
MRICFLAALIMISWNAFAYDSDTCFPGKTHDLSSPSGTHRFVWKEPKDQNDEHHLFYGKKNSEPREFLTFGRYVCIRWSPDERYFSISDYAGSNVAETYIYKTDDLDHPINVTDLLPENVLTNLRKGVWHGYVEAVSWKKAGLFIRVYGDRDGEPRGFDVTLKCYVEKDKWACAETTANK